MPTRKVSVSALAGAIVAVGVWAASTFWKVTIPAEIAATMTVIVSAFVGYMVPEASETP
jgi:hypothetical protein